MGYGAFYVICPRASSQYVTPLEPCHRLGQGKSGRQRGTATDQMDKRGTLDQEQTVMHESGCRILPTQSHMGPRDFQVTCSIEL